MVKIGCSASDRIRVPARPAQHVHRRVPDLRRHQAATPDAPECIYHRRRATLDLTIGPQAGARPERVPTSAVARERPGSASDLT